MRVHPNPPPPLPLPLPLPLPSDTPAARQTDSAARASEIPGNSATPGLAAATPVSSGEALAQSNSVSSDTVAVSGPAAVLTQALEQRAERLESLSAAVRGGAYEPSSAAIGHAITAQAIS
jgi:hypothetical protein